MSLPIAASQQPVAVHAFARDSKRTAEHSELVFYWQSVYRRKWWILGTAITFGVLAGAGLSAVTPVYRSTVTLLVEQNKAKVVSIDEVYSGVSPNREHYQTQAEILRSPALAALVIEKLNLTTHPEFDPRQKQPSFLQRTFVPGASKQNADWTEEKLQGAVLADFLRRVSVEPVRLSQLVKVGFDSADPQLAARAANAIAEQYIESDVDIRYHMTQRASDWLADRLIGLKRSLDDSETALQQYREREGMLDTKGLAQSGAGRQIEVLSLSVEEATQRRVEAENNYKQIRSGKENLDAYPLVLHNPVVERLHGIEGEAEKKLAMLSQRYGPEHARIIQAQRELVQARENSRRAAEAVVASFAKEYEVASANEHAIQKSLAGARSSVQNLNRREFRLEALERDVVTNREIYERFLNRYKETSAAPDVQSSVVARVVDPAIAPGGAYKPPKARIIQFAVALGLLFGVIGAVLRERADTAIKSAEQVEEKLGLPTVAVLPLLSGKAAKSAGRHYLEDPRSMFSEAIRTARTSILMSAIDVPSKVLLVTSAVPGEGKSAFAINLALAHAQTKKVLLIEADLRRPSVAQHLGLDASRPGLTDLFSGNVQFSQCLQQVEGSSLYVLPSGPSADNPLELLSSQRFKLLLERIAAACDIVIIDSPPVHLVSDAVVLSTMTTGVLFVVSAATTPYPVARRVIRTLQAAGANILGVALNQVNVDDDRYYGAYASDIKARAPQLNVSRAS